MANKLSKPVLKERLTGIRIDLSNMAEDLKQRRSLNPDFFNDVDKAELKELNSLTKRVERIINRLQ